MKRKNVFIFIACLVVISASSIALFPFRVGTSPRTWTCSAESNGLILYVKCSRSNTESATIPFNIEFRLRNVSESNLTILNPQLPNTLRVFLKQTGERTFWPAIPPGSFSTPRDIVLQSQEEVATLLQLRLEPGAYDCLVSYDTSGYHSEFRTNELACAITNMDVGAKRTTSWRTKLDRISVSPSGK